MKISNGLNTLNSYNRVNESMMKSIQKLSSGKQINNASNNAAGMAISEKMKAQIRGLQKAEKNIQDGISLVQTAEAGLGQIQNPHLIRMRELVIQAANGTLTLEDKKMIQKEIDQIKESINGIAENTEFNTIKVLKPPTVLSPGGMHGKAIDIVFFIDDSSSMTDEIGLVKSGIGAFVSNLAQFGDVKVGTVSVNSAKPNIQLPLQSNPQTVIDYMDSHHNAVAGSIAMYDEIMNYSQGGSKEGSMGYRAGSDRIFVLLTDTTNEVQSQYTPDTIKAHLTTNNIQSYLFGIHFSGDKNYFSADSSYSFVDKIYKPATPADVAENITPGLAETIIEASDLRVETQKPIILQVGPNEGQTIVINLFDNRTASLEIDALTVETYDEAMDSLNRIDKASDIISERRGLYGAYQNRLEHALRNVQNYEMNLTSALSRIEDVDMAAESTELAKNQILLQASQAMIAQVNQMNQGVLEILK
ncbi:flagellin [Sporosarcina sp. E16_8]|uniref:flagellin n=1 Tax=Sporosarcina sp. E16_8 TaxID=2789295 RepID=UPI001A91144B|nr:flagellin [Sporosarcina sp. E16_8]MBO0588980.1 flagellin [Sporosarcina sp. E16_8]